MLVAFLLLLKITLHQLLKEDGVSFGSQFEGIQLIVVSEVVGHMCPVS